MSTQHSAQLASTAEELFANENYQAAGSIYQELIELYPESHTYYWKLGLSLLLQEQEAEAQMCWMSVFMNGTESEVEQWTNELAEILEAEAQRQAKRNNIHKCWLIRQHLREGQPENINNILALLHLCVALKYPLSEFLSGEVGLIELLNNAANLNFDIEFLLVTLSIILRNIELDETVLLLVDACLSRSSYINEARDRLVAICIEFEKQRRFKDAILLGERYLSVVDPNDLELLAHLPGWYSKNRDTITAIEVAKKRITLCKDSAVEEVFSRHLLIKLLLGTGGHWQEALNEVEMNRSALLTIKEFNKAPDLFQVLRLVSTSFFYPYIQDCPIQNRQIINHIANLFSHEVQKVTPSEIEKNRIERLLIDKRNSAASKARRLKIGYVSYCLKRHSVGWIARWLIQHHDHESFETYGYLIKFDKQNPFQNWYIKQFDHACRVGIDCPDIGVEIAKQISHDEIDILIDLDSITLDFTCEVMVHKPAPIQVTWLGWDASGIPEIDYYIADNYVLPEDAQSYYSEKLWRLPETYVAVDGFEVEVPKLSRESLGIPAEAITYLTAQGGYKRNPDALRMQLSVIKGVPSSYLLIKGVSNSEDLQNLVYQLAKEIGVEQGRLIFLPMVASEEIHRANLRVADVVLDTYPYNGATTTLETLWMEIPLVTLVGKQFSARNSYTMLKNVGVEEGIAWSDEEYIDWGIKLGTDAKLRQQVVWKLRESKKSAPLWDSKAFTRNMEKAYREMWENYLCRDIN